MWLSFLKEVGIPSVFNIEYVMYELPVFPLIAFNISLYETLLGFSIKILEFNTKIFILIF